MKQVTANDIQDGDKLVNIGKVARIQKFDTGHTGIYCNITVIEGPIMSCAFYWIKATAKLWIENEQAPVDNSKTKTLPPKKS